MALYIKRAELSHDMLKFLTNFQHMFSHDRVQGDRRCSYCQFDIKNAAMSEFIYIYYKSAHGKERFKVEHT